MSVAVKEIEFVEKAESEKEPKKSSSTEERILNEIKVLSDSQQQDFVVEYFGFYKDETKYYLVTRQCLSIDLIALFKVIPLRRQSEMALVLIVAIADALSNLHQLGFVHRDVKPANILLDSSGVPKLIDFGLARPITEEAIVSQSGTEFYIGPEAYYKGPMLAAYDSWGLGITALNFAFAKKAMKLYDDTDWGWYTDHMVAYEKSEESAKRLVEEFTTIPSFPYKFLNKHEELLLKVTREEMLMLEPVTRPCAEDVKKRLKEYLAFWEHDDTSSSRGAKLFYGFIRAYRTSVDNSSKIIKDKSTVYSENYY